MDKNLEGHDFTAGEVFLGILSHMNDDIATNSSINNVLGPELASLWNIVDGRYADFQLFAERYQSETYRDDNTNPPYYIVGEIVDSEENDLYEFKDRQALTVIEHAEIMIDY